MQSLLKLMAILAHPDDESLGIGGTLAKYAAEGVETYLVTATRGEHGWFGAAEDYPGPKALAQIREGELRAAAQVLGVRRVKQLGYEDGYLDQAEPAQVIGQLVHEIRRVRPQVVVTFDTDGAYGHPDHIAISQFATAAIVAAAYAGRSSTADLEPHQVSKLYYMLFTAGHAAAYQAAFGDLVMQIDGVERRPTNRPAWMVTTRIETRAYWEQVWQAVSQHCSQLPGYQVLKHLPAEHHENLWGTQSFYRAFSLVNGGRSLESDLFAGLR